MSKKGAGGNVDCQYIKANKETERKVGMMKTPTLLSCLTAAVAGLGLGQPAHASGPPGPQLTLKSGLVCYTDTQVMVSINVSDLDGQEICGAQFFLEYDNIRLDFKAIRGGDSPWSNQIFLDVDEVAGTIDYAVGVPFGRPGSSADARMALITFNILVPICNTGDSLVTFRTHVPPTGLTDCVGNQMPARLNDLPDVGDKIPPQITRPADISVQADAFYGCAAVVDPGTATATDNCTADRDIEIKCNREDGLHCLDDPYPSGTTKITWRATDQCGNYSEGQQVITVSDANDLMLHVALKPVVEPGPFTRAITLELYPAGGPPVIVCRELQFNGGEFLGKVKIPCGNYICITARDPLHSLRRTLDTAADFGVEGTQYVAVFTPANEKELIGGNLNRDCFIDIRDFGTFVGQFGDLLPVDTRCFMPQPHSDINGNGVVWVKDFTFIAANFLKQSDPDCAGTSCVLAADGAPGRPITRISVNELNRRGLDDLAVGDLNHDGWLDILDMVDFMLGERP